MACEFSKELSVKLRWILIKLNEPFLSYLRIEQTATLRVDNGPIATGASPGKLRQLNGNGQLFVGKMIIFSLFLQNSGL